MKNNITVEPVIAYLDQNVVSHIVRAEEGEPWSRIGNMFVTAAKIGAVQCPLPMETLTESSRCNLKTRVGIQNFFAATSGAKRFRSFWEILVDETLALVRTGSVQYFQSIRLYEWASDEKAAQFVASQHLASLDSMSAAVASASPDFGEKGNSLQACYEGAALERAGKLWRDLERFLDDQKTPMEVYEDKELIGDLLKRNLSVREAEGLRFAIAGRKWDAIRVNLIYGKIGALWDRDLVGGRRAQANDEIDRWRASVALTCADVFIGDKYFVKLCRQPEVAMFTSTAVLSANEVEVIEELLRLILATNGDK